jgi:hypothetical protein
MARIATVHGIVNHYGDKISSSAIGFLLCKMAWPALGQIRSLKQI